MNKDTQHKSIEEKIIESIKDGEVVMKPKWYFLLHTVLAVIGLIIILCVTLYICSFIIFYLKQTGVLFVPAFGMRGWFEFLVSLPWVLLGLCLIFFIVLEILVRRYAFAYSKPVLFSLLGVVLFVLCGAVILDHIAVHSRIWKSIGDNKIVFVDSVYKQYGLEQKKHIRVGTIVEVGEQGFVIQNKLNNEISIFIATSTMFPSDREFLSGDTVVVFGDTKDGVFNAVGVEKVEPTLGPQYPRPYQKKSFKIVFPAQFLIEPQMK